MFVRMLRVFAFDIALATNSNATRWTSDARRLIRGWQCARVAS
jgi:hypothetical protein